MLRLRSPPEAAVARLRVWYNWWQRGNRRAAQPNDQETNPGMSMSETITKATPRPRATARPKSKKTSRKAASTPKVPKVVKARAPKASASAAQRAQASRTKTKAARAKATSPVQAVREKGADIASRGAALVSDTSRLRVPLIVAGVVLLVVVALDAPVQGLYCAWRDQGIRQATLDELNADIEEYQGDIDRLQSREGIEDEARRRGYVSAGETDVIVVGLPAEQDGVEEVAPERPWYVVVGDFIFQYGGLS